MQYQFKRMTKTVETLLLNYSGISLNGEAWICHISGGALTIWSSRIFLEGRFTCSFTTTLRSEIILCLGHLAGQVHLSCPISFSLMFADDRSDIVCFECNPFTIYTHKYAHAHHRPVWLLPVFFHPSLPKRVTVSQFTAEMICLLPSSSLFTWSSCCDIHSGDLTMSHL